MSRRVFVFVLLLVLALWPSWGAAQPVTSDELYGYTTVARGFLETRGHGVLIAVSVDGESERVASQAMQDGMIDEVWLPIEEEGMIEGLREVRVGPRYLYADEVRIFTGVTEYFGTFQTVSLTVLVEDTVLYAIYEAGVMDSVVEDYIGQCFLNVALADAPEGFSEFEFDW